MDLEERFVKACQEGDTELAKSLGESHEFNQRVELDAFVKACEGFHRAIVEWFLERKDDNTLEVNEVLCENGSFEAMLWFYKIDHGQRGDEDEVFAEFIGDMCMSNLPEAANWAHSLRPISLEKRKEIFIEACEEDQFGGADWLFGLGGIDLHFHDDIYFSSSYHYDNDMKFIWDLGDYDYTCPEAFWYACMIGDLSIAKKLWKKNTLDKAELAEGFVKASNNNHEETLRWAWSKLKSLISTEALFYHLHEYKDLEAIQWLCRIEIANKLHHKVFRCYCGEWIVEDEIEIVEEKDMNMARWCVSLGGVPFQESKWYMAHLRRRWKGTIKALAFLSLTFSDFIETRYAPGGKGFLEAKIDFESKRFKK